MIIRLYDEREKDFEIFGIEEIKKYLGEVFENCADASDIDELLLVQNEGVAGYRCEEIDHNSKEIAIEIIKKSGSTEREAINHLENGAIIYELSEADDFIKNAVNCCNSEAEALIMWNELETVIYHGAVFKIDFVL